MWLVRLFCEVLMPYQRRYSASIYTVYSVPYLDCTVHTTHITYIVLCFAATALPEIRAPERGYRIFRRIMYCTIHTCNHGHNSSVLQPAFADVLSSNVYLNRRAFAGSLRSVCSTESGTMMTRRKCLRLFMWYVLYGVLINYCRGA